MDPQIQRELHNLLFWSSILIFAVFYGLIWYAFWLTLTEQHKKRKENKKRESCQPPPIGVEGSALIWEALRAIWWLCMLALIVALHVACAKIILSISGRWPRLGFMGLVLVPLLFVPGVIELGVTLAVFTPEILKEELQKRQEAKMKQSAKPGADPFADVRGANAAKAARAEPPPPPKRHVVMERSGLPGTLADTESLGFFDGIRAILRQRWLAWLERHLGHSAKQRLDVRGDLAKSGDGMLKATVSTQSSMASVIHNQVVLERAARGEGPIPASVGVGDGPSILSGPGTPLISGLPGTEALEPAALAVLVYRALADLGRDLDDPAVRSAWSKWEQEQVRRYRPDDAQALIDAARLLLEEKS